MTDSWKDVGEARRSGRIAELVYKDMDVRRRAVGEQKTCKALKKLIVVFKEGTF